MKFDAKSRVLLASCIALLGCSVWQSSAQKAQAAEHEGRLRFRDFREQNSGLSRHAVRKMFQIEKRAGQGAGPKSTLDPSTFAVQCGADGIIRCGTEIPELSKRELRVRNQSVQLSDSGSNSVRLQSGFNLDLTSQTDNIVLGEKLLAGVGSVTITVGGESKTVSAGSKVTAAEYVAVKQILSGGNQSVVVDARGVASGGNVDFGALTDGNEVMKTTNLVIASNVTTSGDFGKHSDFRLTGDLTNYGSLNLQSSDLNVRSGAVRADDITNHSGAKISSAVDLTLEAAGRLNNFGLISSDQNLTLTSNDSVNNTGSVRANGNIDLNSAAINNNGVIRSNDGNINLNGAADAELAVNNVNGIINAANGAINLRNAEYGGSFDSTINGGDLLSRELNMHSGNGAATVRVDALSGLVNQTGAEAHVWAFTDELNIGAICLTGDPTIYNSQGGINITADITVNENLVFIATGNITTAPGVKITARDSTKGYEIDMIAGASFEADGGQDSPNVPPIDPEAPGDVSVFDKPTKSGGGIFLGSGTIIDTRPTGANGRGGQLFLTAFGKEGVVDISGATILGGGTGTGDNGLLTILAGAKSGDSIQIGAVNLIGGTGLGDGSLLASCATPKSITPGQPVVFDENGNRDGIFTVAQRTKGNILFLDSAIGNDVSATVVSVFTLGNITVAGDITTTALTSLTAGLTIAPLSDTAGSVTSQGVTLSAGQNIGKVVDPVAPIPLPVTTNAITVTAGGDVAAVDILGSGNLNIVEARAARLIINAPNRSLGDIDPLSAANVELTIFDAVNVPIQNYSSFTLNTLNPAYNLTGTAGSVSTLTLFSAGGIGTSGSSFQLNSVGVVNATSFGDMSFSQQTERQTSFDLFSTNGSILLIAGGDATVRGAAAPLGRVNVTMNKTDGTLIFRNAITARDSIDIVHNGDDPKSKIIFASDTTVETTAAPGLGAIGIMLGELQPIITNPDFDNVQIVESGGALVTFFGSGITAKKPVNVLTAKGASINISNEFKSKNISLGGNVKITADP